MTETLVVQTTSEFAFRRLKKRAGRDLLIELFSPKQKDARYFAVRSQTLTGFHEFRGFRICRALSPAMFTSSEDLTKRRKSAPAQLALF